MVQDILDRAARDGNHDLGDLLGSLRDWSESIGYFDHLKEENIYLEHENRDLGVKLRLQVNYSRMGYSLPEGERPACPLCIENVGVPGKVLLRVYKFNLGGRMYFAHLTPFPLHPGHFVVNRLEHTPMCVDRHALEDSWQFISQCQGWLAASNSDVEWAGASVLQHHHIQVFQRLSLPIQRAQANQTKMKQDTEISTLHWPCPALRITGTPIRALDLTGVLIREWKVINPGKNTCNYLLGQIDRERIQIHLLLRNPDYRTGEELRAIKSEGVGIIEMAGEIIVPPRPELSRSENHRFFENEGPALVPLLISSNAPKGGMVDEFIRRIFESGSS